MLMIFYEFLGIFVWIVGFVIILWSFFLIVYVYLCVCFVEERGEVLVWCFFFLII